MPSLYRILALSTVVATALAAVTPLHTVEKFQGVTNGKFIVKLKDGVPKAKILEQVAQGGKVTHDWNIINGFAGV